MMTTIDMDKKWAEVLQYAREHATGQGMHG